MYICIYYNHYSLIRKSLCGLLKYDYYIHNDNNDSNEGKYYPSIKLIAKFVIHTIYDLIYSFIIIWLMYYVL